MADTLTIEDIQTWNVAGRVGCIVMEWRGDWNALACGMIRIGGYRQKTRPARICRKCRAALPRLQKTEQKESTDHEQPLAQGNRDRAAR